MEIDRSNIYLTFCSVILTDSCAHGAPSHGRGQCHGDEVKPSAGQADGVDRL
jgi:hypothetical protein